MQEQLKDLAGLRVLYDQGQQELHRKNVELSQIREEVRGSSARACSYYYVLNLAGIVTAVFQLWRGKFGCTSVSSILWCIYQMSVLATDSRIPVLFGH